MKDPLNPDYYRRGGIETIDFIEAKGLGFHEGAIVKYISRWREKGGVEDLKKARWFLDRLIAKAEPKEAVGPGMVREIKNPEDSRTLCPHCQHEYCLCGREIR